MNCCRPMKLMIVSAFFLAATAHAGQTFDHLPLLGQPIRAVVSDSNPPPFAIFDNQGQLNDGVAKQMLEQMASDLRVGTEYQNVPRARVMEWLTQGKADIACFLNPVWVDEPAAVDWSVALLTSPQVIVRLRSASAVTQLSDLDGKRIGTTRGFFYPEFNMAFLQKQMIRDDAISLSSNLQRLAQGRLDAVLSVDLSFRYTLKQNPKFAGVFSADPLWSEAPTLHCAVSQSSPKRMQLLRQLARMDAEGRMLAILTSYQ